MRLGVIGRSHVSLGTALVMAFVLALSSGCTTPVGSLSSSSTRTRTAVPDWSSQPLSWSKLEDIERWLSGSGPREHPGAVPEAELALAEGRLALAMRDSATINGVMLEARLDRAEAGFRKVLSDSSALGHHRARANDGLGRLAKLRPTVGRATGAPSVLSRASWGARPANTRNLRRAAAPWTRITVHHSAMRAAGFGGAAGQPSASAIRRIQDSHMSSEGWGDIGYHFLVDPAGRLYQGRSLEWQGAHAGGANNVGNIGICLLGDFESERPDPRALATLSNLLGTLRERHRIPRTAIKGHRDYKATACPGAHLAPWVERYALHKIAQANIKAPTARPIQ